MESFTTYNSKTDALVGENEHVGHSINKQNIYSESNNCEGKTESVDSTFIKSNGSINCNYNNMPTEENALASQENSGASSISDSNDESQINFINNGKINIKPGIKVDKSEFPETDYDTELSDYSKCTNSPEYSLQLKEKSSLTSDVIQLLDSVACKDCNSISETSSLSFESSNFEEVPSSSQSNSELQCEDRNSVPCLPPNENQISEGVCILNDSNSQMNSVDDFEVFPIPDRRFNSVVTKIGEESVIHLEDCTKVTFEAVCIEDSFSSILECKNEDEIPCQMQTVVDGSLRALSIKQSNNEKISNMFAGVAEEMTASKPETVSLQSISCVDEYNSDIHITNLTEPPPVVQLEPEEALTSDASLVSPLVGECPVEEGKSFSVRLLPLRNGHRIWSTNDLREAMAEKGSVLLRLCAAPEAGDEDILEGAPTADFTALLLDDKVETHVVADRLNVMDESIHKRFILADDDEERDFAPPISIEIPKQHLPPSLYSRQNFMERLLRPDSPELFEELPSNLIWKGRKYNYIKKRKALPPPFHSSFPLPPRGRRRGRPPLHNRAVVQNSFINPKFMESPIKFRPPSPLPIHFSEGAPETLSPSAVKKVLSFDPKSISSLASVKKAAHGSILSQQLKAIKEGEKKMDVQPASVPEGSKEVQSKPHVAVKEKVNVMKKLIRIPCEFCNLVFRKKAALIMHVRMRHRLLKKCPICKEVVKVKGKSGLKAHVIEVHNGDKNFKCEECNETFILPQYVKYHRKLAHSASVDDKSDEDEDEESSGKRVNVDKPKKSTFESSKLSSMDTVELEKSQVKTKSLKTKDKEKLISKSKKETPSATKFLRENTSPITKSLRENTSPTTKSTRENTLPITKSLRENTSPTTKSTRENTSPTTKSIREPTTATTKSPREPTTDTTKSPREPTTDTTKSPREPTSTTKSPREPTSATTKSPKEPISATTKSPREPISATTKSHKGQTSSATESHKKLTTKSSKEKSKTATKLKESTKLKEHSSTVSKPNKDVLSTPSKSFAFREDSKDRIEPASTRPRLRSQTNVLQKTESITKEMKPTASHSDSGSESGNESDSEHSSSSSDSEIEEPKKFFCKHCNEGFSHMFKLSHHYKKSHSPRKKNSKPSENKDEMKNKNAVTTETKSREAGNYSCKHCKQKFLELAKLNAHNLIHKSRSNERGHKVTRSASSALDTAVSPLVLRSSRKVDKEPVSSEETLTQRSSLRLRSAELKQNEVKNTEDEANEIKAAPEDEERDEEDEENEIEGGSNDRPAYIVEKGKGFYCTKCSLIFPREKSLTYHLKKIHETLYPFRACPHCSRIFRSCGPYLRHMSLHTGKKCPISGCKAKYKALRMIKKHQRNAHPEMPHRCSRCVELYEEESELQEHMESRHMEKKKGEDDEDSESEEDKEEIEEMKDKETDEEKDKESKGDEEVRNLDEEVRNLDEEELPFRRTRVPVSYKEDDEEDEKFFESNKLVRELPPSKKLKLSLTEMYSPFEMYSPSLDGNVNYNPSPEVVHTSLVEPQIESDTNPEIESDTNPEIESDTNPEIESDTGPQIESDTGPQIESDTGPQIESDTGPQIESDTNPVNIMTTIPQVRQKRPYHRKVPYQRHTPTNSWTASLKAKYGFSSAKKMSNYQIREESLLSSHYSSSSSSVYSPALTADVVRRVAESLLSKHQEQQEKEQLKQQRKLKRQMKKAKLIPIRYSSSSSRLPRIPFGHFSRHDDSLSSVDDSSHTDQMSDYCSSSTASRVPEEGESGPAKVIRFDSF